jgi:hypothetical protein
MNSVSVKKVIDCWDGLKRKENADATKRERTIGINLREQSHLHKGNCQEYVINPIKVM